MIKPVLNNVQCMGVLREYDGFISNHQGGVSILTSKGADGKSILDGDRTASACGIDPDTLERLAKQK
jgi:hypothetical protein